MTARRITLLLALVLALGVQGVPARADADVEAFAKGVIDEGLAILRGDADAASRHARFHAFILPHIDGRRTGLFALGKYRRGAAAAALDAYVTAFTEYSTAMYETRLDNYKDATLTVTGSDENRPGDFVVKTLANAKDLREPVNISFRVLGAKGSYKIMDIQVEGIWLSIELRDEFGAILGQNGGRIEKLTDLLIERTKRIREEDGG